MIPPSEDDLWLEATAQRQSLLARCDRSPAVFTLVLDGQAPEQSHGHAQPDRVAVRDRDGRSVGLIPLAVTAAYRTRLRRLHRRGVEVAVHGQVVRRDLDLCVVLHCPPPQRWPRAAR